MCVRYVADSKIPFQIEVRMPKVDEGRWERLCVDTRLKGDAVACPSFNTKNWDKLEKVRWFVVMEVCGSLLFWCEGRWPDARPQFWVFLHLWTYFTLVNSVQEVVKEEEEEPVEGDAAVNRMFQKIYKDASDDVRKAMMKSYRFGLMSCFFCYIDPYCVEFLMKIEKSSRRFSGSRLLD